MDRIKKNFGFGYMRLPLLENGEVDKEQTCKMVDTFLENGFNYFDTAHGYLDGKSEMVDYEDPAVQSRKCYEVCRKYDKKVLIMEPVKGGNLVNLPEDAKKILDDLHGGSPASYALRFAAGFEGVLMVLSGMSTLDQMEDNISFMKEFKHLNEKELEAVHQVADIFHQKHMIPCTACRYCVAGCPKHISIPDLFSCMNAKMVFHDWNADYYYNMVHTARNGKASECVKCGKCEKVCPQHLKIREILEDVAKEFEKPQSAAV